MRSLLAQLIFLLLPLFGSAQQHRGRVSDGFTGEGLGSVLIANTHNNALWLSDSVGGMVFTAYPGDIIRFSHPGYKAAEVRISGYNDDVTIGLQRAPIELKGVEVLSPMARFKQDSALNRLVFRKQLGYAHSQIGMTSASAGTGFGIGVGGIFSELALLASGKKKEARRFRDEMLFLEGMQFSNIRYTPSLVAAQTGLSDSASERFIVRNPIPSDYLRVASELELKQRIRDMYRDELKQDSLKATAEQHSNKH